MSTALTAAAVIVLGVATYALDDELRPPARSVPATTWHHLGDGMDTNISGATHIDAGPGHTAALVVRDNKDAGENRVSIVTFDGAGVPVLTPVDWAGEAPSDIEAVDAVPGVPGRFVTLTSAGDGQLITLGPSGVTVDRTFTVPDQVDEPNYEGFALATLGGRTVAVWADRGQEARPATVFAAPFDAATGRFGKSTQMEVTAPYPTEDARDVSDIKILPDGTLLATAAWEEDDNGPFDGAVYVPGHVGLTAGGAAVLTAAPDAEPVLTLNGRKAEAISCGDGGCVLGADNELKGGSLSVVPLPQAG